MTMIIAHRGGAGLRPENTLAACAHALALGADGLEIDVRLSRDGEVVVFHDTAPDPAHVRREGGARLSGASRRVRELSLQELRRFDVGWPRESASGVTVPGERIPLLSELLDFLGDLPGTPLLLIELKTDFHTLAPLDPHELTDAVLGVLKGRAGIPFHLMSFDWRCLTRAMKSLPSGRCVFLTAPGVTSGEAPWFAGHSPARFGGSAIEAIRALGGVHWGPHFGQLGTETVNEARQAGFEIATWTVNEVSDMKHIQTMAIDCLITDFPDRALSLRNSTG
jgi:glycerophosphoryl diester phosphodiesterase